MYRILVLFLFVTGQLLAQNTELNTWSFYSEKDSLSREVHIPHTWNAEDAFDDEPGYWRGKGVYTTTIDIRDTSKVYFLKFKGANQVAEVFVNNEFVGQHYGGYTAFQFDISKKLKPGKNKIRVELDNAHDETVPPLDADFTFYGGMYRKVMLVEESKLHFAKNYGTDEVRIDPFLNENSGARLKITAKVENPEKEKFSLKISLTNPDGEEIYFGEKKSESAYKLEIPVKAPRLWSPEDPNLYSVKLELIDREGKIKDIYEHKTGFRKFEATAGGFKLNGKPLKLLGVNRHQDWEGLGNAVPIEKQLQDMTKIKEIGANFLRLAHYPQAEEIYKAADSLGLILWSEAPVVNKVPATADYEAYKEHSVEMQKEHIAQNYNHPSFVFIGYMNEIFIRMVFDEDDEQKRTAIIDHTLKLAKTLEELTRRMAPNHITVMAIHGNQIYNRTGITEIPMVLGWNLYYGWYEGEIEDLGGFLDKEQEKFPNRPLIISEYGVGADVRLHSDTPEKFDFTEEYQLTYHQGYLEQVLERDFVIGMTAWNFADFGSEFRGDTKPHVNQKGLVNYDRSPKNIWYWYKAVLRPEEKFSRFYRDLPAHISNSPEKKFRVISNQEVILELNGRQIAEAKPENGIITKTVKLQQGENVLKVYNEDGVLQDSLKLFWRRPDLTDTESLSINFGANFSYMAEDGEIWIPAEAAGILETGGETKKVKSSTNIRDTADEPLYQTGITGVKSLKFQLPEGSYRLKLLFANLGKDKTLAYELSKEGKKNDTYLGKFQLSVNGKEISVVKMEKFHKTEQTIFLEAEGLLEIKAVGNQTFSINAIRLESTGE
ncbi:glycoside hydrolase family 2 TIM barrel-domain containing protein [Salegentibacter chungangensis]|uniref:Glycoside hydrolase family 2 TIM barrel-domain containing protein n=1 Tax=Salegentibacter chungangensis TaxID=1335724 RepID=A0ABW3NPU3_9FLAO